MIERWIEEVKREANPEEARNDTGSQRNCQGHFKVGQARERHEAVV